MLSALVLTSFSCFGPKARKLPVVTNKRGNLYLKCAFSCGRDNFPGNRNLKKYASGTFTDEELVSNCFYSILGHVVHMQWFQFYIHLPHQLRWKVFKTVHILEQIEWIRLNERWSIVFPIFEFANFISQIEYTLNCYQLYIIMFLLNASKNVVYLQKLRN